MYNNYYSAQFYGYNSFNANYNDPTSQNHYYTQVANINQRTEEDHIADSMAKLWSERRDEVDSYGQWIDLSIPERQKLYDTVFEKDYKLFNAVMNKLLPNTKRTRVKLERHLDEVKERELLSQICSTFHLKSSKNNKNQIILSKKISKEEKENRKEVRQIRSILVESTQNGTNLSIEEAQKKQKLKYEKEKRMTKEEIDEQKRLEKIEKQKILECQKKIKEQRKVAHLKKIEEQKEIKEKRRIEHQKQIEEERKIEEQKRIEHQKKMEEQTRLKEEKRRQLEEEQRELKKQAIKRQLKNREKLPGDDYEKIGKEKALKHKKELVTSGQPIASDNIGYRLLQGMGWKKGDKIGVNDNGLAEPLSVITRAKNLGLGA